MTTATKTRILIVSVVFAGILGAKSKQFLTMFSLNPDECFFMDDQEDNISTAKKLGIHGSVFIT